MNLQKAPVLKKDKRMYSTNLNRYFEVIGIQKQLNKQ